MQVLQSLFHVDPGTHVSLHMFIVQTCSPVELQIQVLQSSVNMEPGTQSLLQVLDVQTCSPVELQMQELQPLVNVEPGTHSSSLVKPSAPGQVEGHKPYFP